MSSLERAETVPAPGERRLYRFGEFQVDPVRRRLLRDGEPVAVTSKAFSLLVVLLERHGQVVEKEELFRRVWPDTYVTEANLTQNVSSLRKALGERASDRRFIVTVPGQGYSFVGDVRETSNDSSGVFPIVRLEEPRPALVPVPVPAAEPPAPLEVDGPAGETRPVEEDAAVPQMLPPAAVAAQPWRRRAVLALAGAALLTALAMVLTLVLQRFGMPLPGAKPAPSPAVAAASPRPSVAVLGFKDLGTRAENAWLDTALCEMLTTELSAGGQARLITGDKVARVRQALVNPDTASPQRLYAALTADLVVTGSYLILDGEKGRQIRLDLQVKALPAGSVVATLTEVDSETGLFDLVARIGARLRRALGLETLSPGQMRAAQELHPTMPEAARLTAEGLARLRAYDPMKARDLLERAAKIDPGSAAIHTHLSRAWSDLGDDARSLQEARLARDLSQSLPRQDRLGIEARFYAAGRQWEQAAEVYRSLWTFFPDDVDLGLQLATALINGGRSSEAREVLATLRQLPAGRNDPLIDLEEARAAWRLADIPGQMRAAKSAADKARHAGEKLALARALAWQGAVLRDTGKSQESAARFREAEALAREVGHPWTAGMALSNLGLTLQAMGELDEAELRHQQSLDIARQLGSSVGVAAQLYNLATIDQDRGRLSEALNRLDASRTAYVEMGDRLMQGKNLAGMAWVLLWQGDVIAAQRSAEEAVAATQGAGNRADEARAREVLASILSWQGEAAEAQRQIDASLRLLLGAKRPAISTRVLAASADTLARIGDLELARRRLEQASAVERKAGDKRVSMLLLGARSRLALRAGDVAEAHALSEDLLRLSRQMGARIVEAWALFELGRAQRAAGDLPAARASFLSSLRKSDETGDALQSTITRLELARLELAAGRSAEAADAARAVVAWAVPRSLGGLEAQAHAVMAEALLGEGRTAEAVVAAARVRHLIHATQDRELALLTAAPLARAEAAAGDVAGGLHDLREAIAEAERIGFVTIAREARLAMIELEAHRAGDLATRQL